MNESDFGHGALPHIEDIRDYQFIGGASAPYDWARKFDIEDKVGTITVENQGGSFSCGGSWAYLSGVLEALANNRPYRRKSRKAVYSQAFVPGGGSDGRVLSEVCRTKGAPQESLCPSYATGSFPLTELQYEHPEEITPEAVADALNNREVAYATVIRNDMDAIAWAVSMTGGAMIGVYGYNNGTWLGTEPQPPASNVARYAIWAHWLYIGKAEMRNGKRGFWVLNSWGDAVGDKGWQWLSEDYFSSGNVWVCWTMTYDMSLIHKPVVQVLPPNIQSVVNKSPSSAWTRIFLDGINRIFGTKY